METRHGTIIYTRHIEQDLSHDLSPDLSMCLYVYVCVYVFVCACIRNLLYIVLLKLYFL